MRLVGPALVGLALVPRAVVEVGCKVNTRLVVGSLVVERLVVEPAVVEGVGSTVVRMTAGGRRVVGVARRAVGIVGVVLVVVVTEELELDVGATEITGAETAGSVADGLVAGSPDAA